MKHTLQYCAYAAVIIFFLAATAQLVKGGPVIRQDASSSGQVSGTVTNEGGAPLAGVFVRLFPRFSRSSIEHPDSMFRPIGITDSSGQYSIANVDSGVYVAYATTYCDMMMRPYCPNWEYASTWYKDAADISAATLIHVGFMETVTIDFVLYKRPIPVPVTVSGTVTDTNGVPISGAAVFVSMFRPSPLDISGSIDLFAYSPLFTSVGLSADAMVVAHATKTDSIGRYKVIVHSGEGYVASCEAKGFLMQWYKEKSNVLEADRMKLLSDSAGVDFRLVPKPNAPWMVSGRVHDSAGTGIWSRVLLHRLTSPFYRYQFARCISTDSLGVYSYEHVPNGKYIVQAIPIREYVPSFYDDGECGVRRWREADTVTVEDGNVSGIDVCVTKAKVHGAGTLSGHVRMPDGSPVAGVVLYARGTADISLTTYGVTDGDGSFMLKGMAEGSIVVSADKVGFESSTDAVAEVTYGGATGEVELQVTPQRTTGLESSGQTNPQKYVLSQNYPNPFNPETMISFSLPERGFTTLRVYNILGQVARTIVGRELPAGDHTFRFNTAEGGRELPAGVYFYELRSGEFRTMRKMVLLK